MIQLINLWLQCLPT